MTARRSFLPGGVLLGLGVGGFFDGIVLHQILQWHHVVSHVHTPNTVANLRLNTLADGLFHLLTYAFTLLGLALLWRAARATHEPWRTSAFVGALLLGFGLFNVVEGLVNHHVLELHHVRDGPDALAYDLGFLAWGAAMILVGIRLTRAEARR